MKKTNIIIAFGLIVLILASRFLNLTFQGLWFDELYVMMVSNPQNSLHDIMQYMKMEFHPPFHFILCNVAFKLFGYSDLVGRVISAIIGSFSIVAIYFLGKEIRDKKLGLLLVIFTLVNPYHLYHSQEVRMYISLFLFCILSFLFFLKAIKTNKFFHHTLFVIFTTLMIYSHYFGAFIILAYSVYFLIIFIKKDQKKTAFGLFISLLTIALLFAPYLGFVFSSATREHWMQLPELWYFFVYLYDYVGKEPVSALTYLTGLGLFIYKWAKNKSTDSINLIIILMLIMVYGVSYIVSIYKPLIQLRCTFVGLPIVILTVVLGIETLNIKFRKFIYPIFIISAIVNVLFINKYYTKHTKENFREMTLLMANQDSIPLILSHYDIFYNYYFEQIGSKNRAINPKDSIPEMLLKDKSTFVILNAHDNVNLMTLPEDYSELINYINLTYKIDTIVYAPYRKAENATYYIKNN
jgi:mannosyltransferase